MKKKETRIVSTPSGEKFEEGYFLTLEELEKLCRDYLADNYDGFVSNEKIYIEHWLKKEGPEHAKGITSQPVNALKSRTGQNDHDKDKTK
jgi:hypothetical protein